MFVATQHLLKAFPISRKLRPYESCLLKGKAELTLQPGCEHVTLFLQSGAAVHCNVEEETMRKQVSCRISFLVRAVGLGRGTKADTVAAPVLASPVEVVSAATVPVPASPCCTAQ